MRKIIVIALVFTSLIFLSCDRDRTNENPEIKPKLENPEPLQDDKLVSYTRTGNLMDELYLELVDKTPELKNLENDIDLLYERSNDSTEEFNSYDQKSNRYYNSADYTANEIRDSTLRKTIVDLIKSSENKYSIKTKEFKTLSELIKQNNSNLADHHTILKIVLTLPIIEKYQNDNLPDKTTLKDLIKEQESQIKEIDKLTPSYQ